MHESKSWTTWLVESPAAINIRIRLLSTGLCRADHMPVAILKIVKIFEMKKLSVEMFFP